MESPLLHTGEIMSVFPCGMFIRANIRHRLYCEPSHRPSKAGSRFIGLYTDKCVWYLASIKTVVTGVWGPDGFAVNSTEKGVLSGEEAGRIEGTSRELGGCFENFSRFQ